MPNITSSKLFKKLVAPAAAVGTAAAVSGDTDEFNTGDLKPGTPEATAQILGAEQEPTTVPTPTVEAPPPQPSKEEPTEEIMPPSEEEKPQEPKPEQLASDMREVAGKEQKTEYERALDDYRKLTNQAMAAYRAEKDDLKRKELWTGIINAVAMIAGGLYGLKHGLDMSGIKVDKTDWTKRAQLAMDEMESSLSQAKAQYGMAKDIIQAKEKQDDRLWNRAFKLAVQRRMTAEAETRVGQSEERLDLSKKRLMLDMQKQITAAEGKERKNLEKVRDNIGKLITNWSKAKGEEEDVLGARVKGELAKWQQLTGQKISMEEAGLLWGTNKRAPADVAEEFTKKAYGIGTAPQETPAAPETVLLRAPDGTEARVKKSEVQKYIDKGAKVIGQ